jgi:hypothetical protein
VTAELVKTYRVNSSFHLRLTKVIYYHPPQFKTTQEHGIPLHKNNSSRMVLIVVTNKLGIQSRMVGGKGFKRKPL